MRYKDFIRDKSPLKTTSRVIYFPEIIGETLFLTLKNRKYKITVTSINNQGNLFTSTVEELSESNRISFTHTFYLSNKYKFYRTENEIQ
jgi:hypothetical protein